jgi:hypothetical protein
MYLIEVQQYFSYIVAVCLLVGEIGISAKNYCIVVGLQIQTTLNRTTMITHLYTNTPICELLHCLVACDLFSIFVMQEYNFVSCLPNRPLRYKN